MKKALSLILAFAMSLSLCACGEKSTGTDNAATQNAQIAQTPQVIYPETTGEKIEFDDLVLAEDKNVKISLVDFHVEKMNMVDGVREEKCATLKIENKTDQTLIFGARAYLDNEEVTVMAMSSNSVEAGRVSRYSASYDYGVYPNFTVVESLDKLYGLEWSLSLTFGAGTSNYNQYDLQFSVDAALNGEVAGAEALVNEAYTDVINMMVGGVWFFNGGSDAAVNKLEFSEDAAIITQIVYDGNGAHTNGVSNFAYLMSDTAVTLTLADGSELVIPYSVNDGAFTLESDAYLTPAEVDAGLQGYWGLRKSENLMGMNSVTEYIYYYNNGQVTYENAAKAQNGGPGEYYYYGPHAGTYTIDNNGLSTTVKNGWACGFNIIDGQVVMVRGGDVCSPVSGFKGQYGYSF